ncbi:hypothetical protein NUACC21_64910 [Scytonema sp. NUACC21]
MIQRFDPIEYIPVVGTVWKTAKCSYYLNKASDLLSNCKKEYNENCGGDKSTEECVEYMDGKGSGNPSDVILNCAKTKNPDIIKNMLAKCSQVAVGSYTKTKL